MRRRFGSCLFTIHRFLITVNDVFVECVLNIRQSTGRIEKFLRVGFVFGEEEFGRAFAVQPALAQHEVFKFDGCRNIL